MPWQRDLFIEAVTLFLQMIVVAFTPHRRFLRLTAHITGTVVLLKSKLANRRARTVQRWRRYRTWRRCAQFRYFAQQNLLSLYRPKFPGVWCHGKTLAGDRAYYSKSLFCRRDIFKCCCAWIVWLVSHSLRVPSCKLHRREYYFANIVTGHASYI